MLGFALRVCAWIVTFSLLGLAAAPAQTKPGMVTVRIASIPNDDMTSVLYAWKSGMFAKAGLDVQIDKASSGAAVATALIGGTYDIGKSSITPIFDAYEKGLPFTIIACAAIYDSKAPYGGMVVAPDSTIRTGKDMNGKIMGINSLNDIGKVAVDAWMMSTGGDPKTVKFLELPMSASPAALAQKRIDAGQMTNPPLAAALLAHQVRMIPAYTAVAPRFLFSVWFTTRDYAAKNPQTVKTFASVVARAARYVNTHHQQTVDMVAQWTGIRPETVATMPRVENGEALIPSQLQPVIDASLRDGVIKKSFSAMDLLYAPVVSAK
ncbi:MAG TPA: ABC transporter substrate-binding protein [Candidatus Acidoferrales bacterium]|jgi:NitT/TauT family transport system substrate-binding protein|nr:ABC transporter substrate-binding protein [Candidatus Acidoferrales bacterium]